jgi:hypothetical protein
VDYAGAPARSRCPGPNAQDAGNLLSARLSVRALGARTVVLRLRRGQTFAGEAHTGRASGAVTVVLRRTSAVETTDVEPAF